MRANYVRETVRAAVLAVTLLVLGIGASLAQVTVGLTAGPSTVTLPDGSTVPMWGYTCATINANCQPLNLPYNPAAATFPLQPPGWSPVVITVPYVATGTTLTINLTNSLTFQPPTPVGGVAPAANTVPTSLMIVGQLGGGLGGAPTRVASPAHGAQSTTWPIANTGAVNNPPSQPTRVQSFGTEVATGTTAALTWSNLRPGTYLIESGTHPSIQGPMGLYGILVVTTPPGAAAGCAYPDPASTTGACLARAAYNAEVPVLFSEIDPLQNAAVQAAVTTAGFAETTVWSGQPGGCGNPTSPTYHQCYPPAVNYLPTYYLVNGLAFNKAVAAATNPSLFPTAPATGLTAGTGTVLVRMVNAGLRMHVPSIVGAQTTQLGAAVTPAPVSGFSLVAEDGNPAPGVSHVQSEVFMAAGKIFDVMVNAPAAGSSALPVYDRELSLSGNAIDRDAGMLAYIGVNGSTLPADPALAPAALAAAGAGGCNNTYASLIAGQTFSLTDPSKGLLANATNVNGVQLLTGTTNGTVTLNANGTFTYVPTATATSDTFTYCANGSVTAGVCSSGLTGSVCLQPAPLEAASGITCTVPTPTYTSGVATTVSIKPPGVLAYCKDAAGYPLTVSLAAGSAPVAAGFTLTMDPNGDGGFTATVPTAGTYSFTFSAQNSQGVVAAASATATLVFPAPSNLAVTVLDGKDKTTQITDYRWVIEEDKTFYVNPACTTNSTTPVAGCPQPTATTVPPTFGVNFHTSHMEFMAQGCVGPAVGSLACESGQTVINPTTGLHVPVACDLGNGLCDTTASQLTPVNPSLAVLDPGCGFGTHTVGTPGCTTAAPYPKRYYISVLPGDAANPFSSATAVGHTMGGAAITWNSTTNSWNPVTVLVQPTPLPTGKLTVSVFEDDFPLNGEQDSGGGVDVIAPNEPGLGGFNIELFDDMGGSGDPTGQMTYDMFNQPLTNSLAGTIDPATGLDACPISQQATTSTTLGTGAQLGIVGQIVTCPKYESDGKTLSALAGQAVVNNLMPGRFSVVATPGAQRIAAGEEWLQTNTLDGQHAHDSFIRIGEPNYFQEYGPAGFHVNIGFANPKIIQARKPHVCNGTDANLTATNCTNTITGRATGMRMSRTPDERLYGSGSRDTFYFTQCYVSIGDSDGEDFDFVKCDAQGNFKFTGIPDGNWRLSIFDQWNDQLMDGLATPVSVKGGQTVAMGDVPVQQWQANVYTRTFMDDNKDGVYQTTEAGIPLINTTVRYRDGSLSNNLGTDFSGVANFNETFPLFNWYVVETDVTRYKTTGIHTVYDAGGPADGSPSCGQPGYPICGSSVIGRFMARTYDDNPLPANLSVPGAVYCATADCTGASIAGGPVASSTTNHSTGRIDPPWVAAEGWQGFSGQNGFIEFGKAPYAPTENGGIHGHVIYASTRPFDDPQMLVQTQWEPLVPHVTINLYREGFAADGVTPTLKLVDTTQTSSWDDWAQGFRSDGMPNMNCPGQSTADLFYFTLYNQPSYLNLYNAYYNGGALTALPYNAQYKCYDGMHNWNQLQPAPYDGMYSFPSVTGINPTTGKPTGTNCTACIPNPDATDAYRFGLPMLPAGKYVVEVVVPAGMEIVKEEDKNILIGDTFIAPVTQQFGAMGNIFIIPDQASVASAYTTAGVGFNANNAQNPTVSLGAAPNSQEVPGFVPEPVWPCVGASRIVPDYISLFPQSQEVAPFAGATRHLCDRKEVTLTSQSASIAKFYVFTSTHIAAKFTGVITDDYTSEFDPFAPTFGEKFSPPSLPVSVKDWAGNETTRVYSDQWGLFNGLTYSTWEVNPPNPTGYSPTMMVTCMNDPGPTLDTRPTIVNSAGATVANPTFGKMITDPLFNPLYSQFCYELPFMPGQTDYMDTPVVPTAGFVGAGYNNPDCAYPTATPAVSEVDGDGVGPWVSAAGHSITINALGDEVVNNYGYSGPSATVTPFNQKTVTRHYGFGARCTAPTAGSATCGTASSVTIGGANATITSWTDTKIVATVPGNVPACAVQQQVQYGNPNTTGTPGLATRCGELVITAGNGRQSVDAVTVTVGGKAPTHVAASASIQAAIDGASPGDMIIVDPACATTAGASAACSATALNAATPTQKAVPAVHNEMLIMWKPLRLQGVGAASSVINANTHPAGETKMDTWRRTINCLFGLALNGQPAKAATNPYDPSGTYNCPSGAGVGPDGNTWRFVSGGPNYPTLAVDRLPREGILGWDASLNGNLAEQLQEPSLMGAYEGAGITVLSKGVNIPANAADVFGSGAEADFPTGSTLLIGTPNADGEFLKGDPNPLCHTSTTNRTNPYPSNFQCNPSAIDGMSITDSSQGGGGIALHGWAHNMQIANNRVYNNAGTLSGGINIGQGETTDGYIVGSLIIDPGSCVTSTVNNTMLPFCFNVHVNVSHNAVTANMSTGDELFSATNGGAGGVSFCSGADYYKFNYNWICGNLSTGDGGGVAHLGFSWNGNIEHNSILFNQSTNPTIPTNGGGLIVQGTPPDITLVVNGVATECGSVTDIDCVPGLSDGVGPGLVINANLIQGNAADSGSGGGLRFQAVNGTEVARFPSAPANWYSVTATNNIIVNNVAGWDGAGVSLEDSLVVNLINNTIASNDTTASSGVLFQTLGAPLASTQSQPTVAGTTANGTTSLPQPAGLAVVRNSPQLVSSWAATATTPALTITCPAGHPNCTQLSYPILYNNIFWQNRDFYVGVGALSSQFQQNVVTLFPTVNQTSTGQCAGGANYWDIGVRGDTGPGNHGSGFTLNPLHSVLTSTGGYDSSNIASNPAVVAQYCNGSRVPPENGGLGYQVPPGIADSVVPNPIFNLTPAATIDEGNNWINMSWGPLSMLNPVTSTGTTNVLLGNYSLQTGSPAINQVTCSFGPGGACTVANEVIPLPEAARTDFFGNRRPDAGTTFDIGAVEVPGR